MSISKYSSRGSSKSRQHRVVIPRALLVAVLSCRLKAVSAVSAYSLGVSSRKYFMKILAALRGHLVRRPLSGKKSLPCLNAKSSWPRKIKMGLGLSTRSGLNVTLPNFSPYNSTRIWQGVFNEEKNSKSLLLLDMTLFRKFVIRFKPIFSAATKLSLPIMLAQTASTQESQ